MRIRQLKVIAQQLIGAGLIAIDEGTVLVSFLNGQPDKKVIAKAHIESFLVDNGVAVNAAVALQNEV